MAGRVIVKNYLRVENGELTTREWKALKERLTFVNGDSEIVECYRHLITRGYAKIPRGAWGLAPLNKLDYYDKRVKPKAPSLNFTVKLDDVERDPRFIGQLEAVKSMRKYEQGLVIRPPGSGKTQIALGFAAQCQTTTLVLVHTEDILQQWIEYAGNAIPELQGNVGIVRGKKREIGHLTIATVQTMQRYVMDESFWQEFGCVILDEAHHAGAATFEAVLNASPAFYRFGFTASPTRADGMHPLMRFTIGPIIHKQKFSSPIPLKVVPVRTQFYHGYRGSFDWQPMLGKLVTDEGRNEQIAKTADGEIEKGNSVLVLSRRIEHLERIADRMQSRGEILTGRRSKKERAQILRDFRDGRISCVLATQLADEALDVPRLNRLLLVHPGKHEGRIIQQIGRTLRKFVEKEDAIVYDFVDWRVRILRRQWDERRRTYRREKISIKSSGRLLWRR